MSNFIPPRFNPMDSDGNPLAGGKLYFYDTGTTTPKATYSDRDRTTPNTNPVVADGNGYFGDIWLEIDAAYTIVLKDSDDNTIWTANERWGGRDEGDPTRTRLSQFASNPLDYGADGDGVSDESSEVQDAIDASTGLVDLLGKTYRCDSQITLKAGVTLYNGTLDFSNSTDSIGVVIAGTGIGSSTAFVADPNVSDGTVASASGFSEGQICFATSLLTWSSLNVVGELQKLTTIDGTTFTFAELLVCKYAAVNGATIAPVSTIANVRLLNVDFVDTNSGADRILIKASFAEKLSIERCTFNVTNSNPIELHSCFDVSMEKCVIETGISGDDGVSLYDSCANVAIDDCTFVGFTNSVYSGRVYVNYGVCRNLSVSRCSIVGEHGSYGIRCDEQTIHTVVEGTRVEANSGLIVACVYLKGVMNTVRNCLFSDGTQAVLVDQDGVTATFSDYIPNNHIIEGNTWLVSDDGVPVIGYYVLGMSRCDLVSICGNKVVNNFTNPVNVTPFVVYANGVACKLIVISDNQVIGGHGPLVGISNSADVGSVIVENNKNYDGATSATGNLHGPRVTNDGTGTIDEARFSGNRCTSERQTGTVYAMHIEGCTVANVCDNELLGDADTNGLYLESIDEFIVNGNYISVGDAPTVETSYTGSTSTGVIVGNRLSRTADTDGNIVLDRTDGVVVGHNCMLNGLHGLVVTNTTNAISNANTMKGMNGNSTLNGAGVTESNNQAFV